MFVESVDTLFGCQVIPVACDDRFPSGPPLVKGGRNKNDKRSLKLHKTMCRSGLPPQYRCAVWITSVTRIANPQLSISEIESYGTIAHAKNINAKWSYALGMTFPNPQDRDDAIAPDFGLGQKMLHQLYYDYGEWNTTVTTLPQQGNKKSIPTDGVKALTSVLCVIHQVLGIEYCPILPDIAMILLTHMPESYVFATIREMIDDTSHFLPVSQKDYYAWCKTYAFFVERMFPHHYKMMKKCGVLDPTTGGLDPIFKRFFITLLKREDLLRFMDIFVIEGGKAIFRLGLSMLHLIPKKTIGLLQITDSSSWWNEIRRRTHDRPFSFQAHLHLMFPKFETISKRYPRRSLLGRMNRFHEKWALEIMPTLIDEISSKPLGVTSSSSSGCVLAKQANVRVNLANWLHPSLKSTKLDLIYSTEKHGRSFVSFYNQCHKTKNTVLLVEAINGNDSSIVGMFASHAWAINHHSIGDGNCFLFRIDPVPTCWYWTPDVHASTNLHDLENLAVREQFMIARSDFIAMGANREGTNGLRLDSDLSKGESHSAAGFDNEPLPGQHHKTFDVGIVEVYQLVRDF